MKDKSAQIGVNTSATMALWNTYKLPKHSASSSTLNSELTNHLQENWPTQEKNKTKKQLAPKLPLKCLQVIEKRKHTAAPIHQKKRKQALNLQLAQNKAMFMC